MGFELKQSLKLSQQLVMTPQLQQAIKLLQLNRQELAELINQELVENPVLEETNEEEERARDGNEAEAPKKEEENTELPSKDDDFNWESFLEEANQSSSTAPSMKEVNEELSSFENALTRTSTLEDHLRWQLSMMTLADEEKNFSELVTGNLSGDGYLLANLEDLAKESQMELEDAEEVLKIITHLDPLGVGSRDLKECLGVQAQYLEPRNELVEKIISNHLSDLEKKNYSAVSKALGISMDDVIATTKVILEFEPKPGRSFQANDTHYITPDIYVYKVANEFVIVLNEDGLPKLKISNYYKNILTNKDAQSGTKENKLTKEYVQDKLRSAMWLIRSIHNRQKTIYKVTEAITKRQGGFFEKGVQKLKPMILKDVANDIGMHESTISRVTTNKYVHTPVGIFELKYFFNSSINANDGGESVASETVKEKIRILVTNEDQKHPLSDQKIVELLKKENVNIARRTVAKYRDMLGILSSGKRRKIF